VLAMQTIVFILQNRCSWGYATCASTNCVLCFCHFFLAI